MFRIAPNGIVTMTRAEYVEWPFFVNCNTIMEPEPYEFKEGDVLCLYIGEANKPFDHALIKKFYTGEDVDEDGKVNMVLESTDTFYIVPNTYYYTIKLVEGGKRIHTLVPKTKFVLID